MVHHELFDNITLESQNKSFLTREKSVAMRLQRVQEEQIIDQVTVDSSVVTKYYALLTLANVGAAICMFDNDGEGYIQAEGDLPGGDDASWDNEVQPWETRRGCPTLKQELMNIHLPRRLIETMWAIYESLTEDEIQ